MSLPFTLDAFLDVFRRYNEAVWPAQWLLVALGVGAVLLAARGGGPANRRASGLLALLWLWTGAIYHLGYFRAINPAAVAFGAMCLLQGVLLAWIGAWRGRLVFRFRRDVAGVAGAVLAAYALVGYPILGALLGHRYPAAPTFGLPCPTTILTCALLLWTLAPRPRAIVVVPLLWAAIATVAAARLGMVEDFGLLVAAAAVAVRWLHAGHAAVQPVGAPSSAHA